jgi:hypothetical protein
MLLMSYGCKHTHTHTHTHMHTHARTHTHAHINTGRREWPFTTRHLVRSVPSLLIFSQGKIRARHDGERSLAQLQAFVHNVTGADTIELGSDSCLLRWPAGYKPPRATPRVDPALVFSMIVLTVLLLFRLYACCRKPATAEKLPVGTI